MVHTQKHTKEREQQGDDEEEEEEGRRENRKVREKFFQPNEKKMKFMNVVVAAR